jgi:gamma-glutamyl:cysteine ligase YbdK (ATP-grasp superfamily)
MIMMEAFAKRFRFNPAAARCVGIERECFLVREGAIVPISPQVLELLPDRDRFGYELSACQLEERIGPCSLADIGFQFAKNDSLIQQSEERLDFSRLYTEVAPETMPLDVFPDPTGRYQEITAKMPRQILLAACRVAAIHVHVGMPNHAVALTVYNKVIKHLDRLCEMGDGSHGQRLAIYREMAPDYLPQLYENWESFYAEAKVKHFEDDPRRCWHLIRISVHGTIEFRMFGTTGNVKKIEEWAHACHALCEEALVK